MKKYFLGLDIDIDVVTPAIVEVDTNTRKKRIVYTEQIRIDRKQTINQQLIEFCQIVDNLPMLESLEQAGVECPQINYVKSKGQQTKAQFMSRIQALGDTCNYAGMAFGVLIGQRVPTVRLEPRTWNKGCKKTGTHYYICKQYQIPFELRKTKVEYIDADFSNKKYAQGKILKTYVGETLDSIGIANYLAEEFIRTLS